MLLEIWIDRILYLHLRAVPYCIILEHHLATCILEGAVNLFRCAFVLNNSEEIVFREPLLSLILSARFPRRANVLCEVLFIAQTFLEEAFKLSLLTL